MTDLMITMQSYTIKLALRLRRIITPTTHLVCSIAYHPAVDSFSFMVITGKMIANGSQPNRPPPLPAHGNMAVVQFSCSSLTTAKTAKQ